MNYQNFRVETNFRTLKKKFDGTPNIYSFAQPMESGNREIEKEVTEGGGPGRLRSQNKDIYISFKIKK
jgi:hypothetical protein